MFNKEKFQTEEFKDRTTAVPVDELRPWFKDDASAVWVVRALHGEELALVRASEEGRRDLAALVAKLAGNQSKERMAGLLEALGLGQGLTPDFAGRLHALCTGSVDPKCDKPLAVRLGKNFPAVFYRLTNEILSLTGQGRVGESTSSGATPPSGPASPCAPGDHSEAGASGSSSK